MIQVRSLLPVVDLMREREREWHKDMMAGRRVEWLTRNDSDRSNQRTG